jgi:hypothetical protein
MFVRAYGIDGNIFEFYVRIFTPYSLALLQQYFSANKQRFTEIWLMLMLMLKCSERKILFFFIESTAKVVLHNRVVFSSHNKSKFQISEYVSCLVRINVTVPNYKTILQDIFSAGSETSSTVLVWAMSELAKNPRVMHKAQLEVRNIFKGQDKITEDDLIKLRYLQLVIKETLRLHAPVPLLLPRESRESCQVMGYDVPKGTKVFVNVWAIARDMKLWHDAEEFRPERFESSSIDFRGNDFEFTPFGAGRRICPGITLGLANLELALASLLYHFDWDLPDGVRLEEFDTTEIFGITLRKKSMLWLKARPYNNFMPN